MIEDKQRVHHITVETDSGDTVAVKEDLRLFGATKGWERGRKWLLPQSIQRKPTQPMLFA